MTSLLLSLSAPLLVIVLGYSTRRILPSLLAGILLASLIASDNPFEAIRLLLGKFAHTLEFQAIYENGFDSAWNLLICIFLIILGVLIAFLHHSGAANAYKKFVQKKLKNKRQAEAASLFMSTGLFVDDYFSILTVGSVMRHVTDSFKIPRAKLAFLADSMGAPLVILCPVSTWVAAITGFMKDSGIHREAGPQTLIEGVPFTAYLSVLPYLFYSFVVIAGTWAIVLLGISFGKMRQHEQIALSTSNVFGGEKAPADRLTQEIKTSASLFDFAFLILSLISFILLGLAHSGGWSLTGGDLDLVEAFRNASAAKGLFAGGIFILAIQLVYLPLRKLVPLQDYPKIIWEGIVLMGPSVLVLILAWVLGDLIRNDLKTGELLAGSLSNNLDVAWLPLVFFLVSVLTSVCIGSSWGAAAVLFPIGVQLYLASRQINSVVTLDQVQSLFPILGAILSGSVAGDHISPISDTTIMSSTSAGMRHSDHVDTQLTYAIPFVIFTAFLFALNGLFN